MASVSIVQKNFSPKGFDSRKVIGSVLAELRNVQEPKMIRLANETIKTWNDPPSFAQQKGQIRFAGGQTSMQLKISGNDKQIKKWIYLNGGTSVRYAVMNNPYYNKTFPGFLGSVSGRGYPVHRGKNIPMSGIKARGWDKLMEAVIMQTYANDIQDAINRGWEKASKK